MARGLEKGRRVVGAGGAAAAKRVIGEAVAGAENILYL
jgi:hypothetical protein